MTVRSVVEESPRSLKLQIIREQLLNVEKERQLERLRKTPDTKANRRGSLTGRNKGVRDKRPLTQVIDLSQVRRTKYAAVFVAACCSVV